MREGVIVSLLLHALALAPLLFVYAPRLSALRPGEATSQTQYVAQTVNIQALRSTPPLIPVTGTVSPVDVPRPIVSEAEQAAAVAPVKPKTIDSSKPKPPPQPESAKKVKPAPLPEQETMVEAELAREAESLPEPQPPPEPKPHPALRPKQLPPKAFAEKESPAAEQKPAVRDKRVAMMHDAPAAAASFPTPQTSTTASESVESDADFAAAVQHYAARVHALLEQQKRYPPMALRLGMEGEVRLGLVLDRHGQVLDYRIEQGSGYTTLDEEVKRLVQQIAAFPPFPPDMGEDSLEFAVPIPFRITDD